jgi:hypothetical protein
MMFGEVIGAAEQSNRRGRPFDQRFHPLEQQAFGKGQIDLRRLEVLLQRLHGGIMAA